jgi:hypothetical protein
MSRNLYTHAAAFLAWPLAQWLAGKFGDRIRVTHGRLHP